MKCTICNKTLNKVLGERAIICSCCGDIVCFDCAEEKRQEQKNA